MSGTRRGSWEALLILVLVISGCGTSNIPPVGKVPDAGGLPGRQAPKILTVAMAQEPGILELNSLGGGAKNYAVDVRPAIQHRLSNPDDHDQVQPQLAAELPTQDNGAWVVPSDGTMQVTWHLRSHLQWHDGTPVTAHDFVFAWEVSLDPAIAMSTRGVAQQVSRIDTPDDRTLVMEWSQSSPLGDNPGELFGPLPAHLLEDEFQSDKVRFQELPYWKEGFIGTGPFRLTRWDAGSELAVEAFDGFYLGRPKLDGIIYRFIPNPPTVSSNLLAGAIDGALSGMQPADVVQVRDQWAAAGRASEIVTSPSELTHLSVQFRDPQPADLLDVRVRRGLLEAIDRQSLVDAFSGGLSSVADTWFTTDDVRWDWVKDVAVHYAYDPREAQQQFEAAGWRRGSDGMYLNSAGQSVTVPIWAAGGPSNEQVIVALANYWKAVGVNAEITIIPPAQIQDNQLRASFPALDISGASVNFDSITRRVRSSLCPTEQTHWTGSNRGCYSNPALDQVSDELVTAVAPDDQRQLWRSFVQIETEELPIIPLNWNVQALLFRDGVSGITTSMLNINEWDIR